jgi:hypothetical protein
MLPLLFGSPRYIGPMAIRLVLGRPLLASLGLAALLGLLVTPATGSRLRADRQLQQAATPAPAPDGVLTSGTVFNDKCVADANPSNINWVGQVADIEQVGVFLRYAAAIFLFSTVHPGIKPVLGDCK